MDLVNNTADADEEWKKVSIDVLAVKVVSICFLKLIEIAESNTLYQ